MKISGSKLIRVNECILPNPNEDFSSIVIEYDTDTNKYIYTRTSKFGLNQEVVLKHDSWLTITQVLTILNEANNV